MAAVPYVRQSLPAGVMGGGAPLTGGSAVMLVPDNLSR